MAQVFKLYVLGNLNIEIFCVICTIVIKKLLNYF